MKNKNGKSKNALVIVILLAIVAIGAYFLISQNVGTITQHAQTPADMSKNSTGTGLKLRLIDNNGNPIEIPTWFSSQTASIVSPFAIVKSPSPASCITVSNCAGYATNPNIMCWSGQCVLGNVGGIYLDFGVTNPSTSQVTFTNVQVTAATPTAFYTARNTSVVSSMAPGSSYTFTMPNFMSITGNGWINTNQTFSVTVSGTNSYTGVVTTASDSYTLGFYPDPTGTLSVSIVKAV